LKGSCLSKAFFIHLNKIINAGDQNYYTEEMLYKLDGDYLHEDFEKFFQFFKDNRKKYKNDFLGLIFNYNKFHLRVGSWIFNLRHFTELTFPFFMKEILNWLEDDKADFNVGLYLAGSLIALVMLRSWFAIYGAYFFKLVNARIKNSVRVSPLILNDFLTLGIESHC
jgi:hypothetical protein